VTILYKERPPRAVDADIDGDDLWLGRGDLRASTGWEIRPEGACAGDVCVPIPRGREPEFLRQGGTQVNLAALAGLLGQPIARDLVHAVWMFGEAAPARASALRSLEAPDFTLPDLDGRLHSLSDFRGRKVFLVTWASW
jgi:hypothetical protein